MLSGALALALALAHGRYPAAAVISIIAGRAQGAQLAPFLVLRTDSGSISRSSPHLGRNMSLTATYSDSDYI